MFQSYKISANVHDFANYNLISGGKCPARVHLRPRPTIKAETHRAPQAFEDFNLLAQSHGSPYCPTSLSAVCSAIGAESGI